MKSISVFTGILKFFIFICKQKRERLSDVEQRAALIPLA